MPYTAPGQMSIEEVRSIWDDEERTHTDEELDWIRDWAYMITSVIIEMFHQEQSKKNSLASE